MRNNHYAGCAPGDDEPRIRTIHRHLTELRARTAKSVFQFDVQGQVANPRRHSLAAIYPAPASKTASTSSRLTAGACRQIARWSPRSTLHSGTEQSQVRGERPTNETLFLSLNGCSARIVMEASKSFPCPQFEPLECKKAEIEVGSSEFCSTPPRQYEACEPYLQRDEGCCG